MADRKDQRPGLPSVLDRLFDDDPGHVGEKSMSPAAVGAALKTAVRRDLEDLLNTRLRPFLLPERLEELVKSSFEFGIPDFSGANLSSSERRRKYLRGIEEIESCWSVAGDESYILKVRVPTPAVLEDLLGRIRAAANVSTRTTIVLSTPYENRPVT